MCDQVGPGDDERNYGGQVKEYSGDEPEGGFPDEVYGFIAGEKFPVPREAGDNNNDAFQDDGIDIDTFCNMAVRGGNYEKKRKQHQGEDKQSFDQGGLYDPEEEPGEHEQFKWSIQVVYDELCIGLIGSKGTNMQQPDEIRVYEELYHKRYEKVDREYPKVAWIGVAVAIQDTNGQGQEVCHPVDDVRYGKNICRHYKKCKIRRPGNPDNVKTPYAGEKNTLPAGCLCLRFEPVRQ